MEENKSQKKYIILVVILLIVVIGLVLFICYDKNIIFSSNDEEISENQTTEVEEDQDEQPTESEETTSNEQKCYGTYYGESSGTYSNGLSYDYKIKYILNEDGTFSADFSGASGTSGTYTISNNIVSFTGQAETSGQAGTTYETTDYTIATDCSYIIYDNGSEKFNLNKQ